MKTKKETAYKWAEGIVNPEDNHVKIRYGKNPIPVALVSAGKGNTFNVQFSVFSDVGRVEEIKDEVRKELDRYLSKKSEENPWPWIITSLCENSNRFSTLRWEYYLKCYIERFGDFEIQWASVEGVRPYGYGHGLTFYLPDIVLAFIEGFEWLNETSNRVRIYVLDPKSKQWDNRLAESRRILGELRECVYIVFSNPKRNLDSELKYGIMVRASVYLT
jgi:hypothetical protein